MNNSMKRPKLNLLLIFILYYRYISYRNYLLFRGTCTEYVVVLMLLLDCIL